MERRLIEIPEVKDANFIHKPYVRADGTIDRDNQIPLERQPVHFYSIAGYYLEILGPRIAFGGYFRWIPKTGEIFDGELTDAGGISHISEGAMDDKKLSFVKICLGESPTILSYRFNNINGIWIGSYEFNNQPFRGKGRIAQCITTLISEEGFNLYCGPPKDSDVKEEARKATDDLTKINVPIEDIE